MPNFVDVLRGRTVVPFTCACDECGVLVGNRDSPIHMSRSTGDKRLCKKCFVMLTSTQDKRGRKRHKCVATNKVESMKNITVSATFEEIADAAMFIELLAKHGLTKSTTTTATEVKVEKPAKKDKPAKAAPPPADDDDDDDDDEEEEEEDDDDDDDEDEDDEDEDEDEEVEAKFELTKDLIKSTKLSEALRILIIDQKITSVPQLVKIAKECKTKVPVFGKVQDLENRIPRSAELIIEQMK